MNKGEFNPVFALRNEKIVHISEVERGLKCGCKCPVCNGLLIARKGEQLSHHFAHYAKTNCEYCGESALHFAAKELLSRAKKMVVPAVSLKFPDSCRPDELIHEAMEIDIDHVDCEKHFGNVIPDVVVYSGKKFFFIEIYVTHGIDERKLAKLKDARVSTLEIDLSKRNGTVTPEELSRLLLDNCEEKTWVYNAKAERYYQMFLRAADKKPIVRRGFALHVDGCPLRCRIWRGKPYANYVDNCYYCKYHITTVHTEDSVEDIEEIGYKYIYCSGAKRIANIVDFKQE